MENAPRPNQIGLLNNKLDELDNLASQGKVQEAARIIQRDRLYTYPFDLYYCVWFECILAKLFVWEGLYRAACFHYHKAETLWQDPSTGFASRDWPGDAAMARDNHSAMIHEGIIKTDGTSNHVVLRCAKQTPDFLVSVSSFVGGPR